MKIMLVLILLFSSTVISQQTDSLLHFALGEVEVIAAKENLLSPTKTGKKDFELHNAFTAFDALQYLPGLSLYVSGKNEAQLSFRGYDQRQISFMMDGAPVYLPFDGSFDLNAAGLAGVDKISIANNYSILYGPNSMGGSVNLLSQRPESDFSGSFNYQGGSRQNLISVVKGILNIFYYTAALGYSHRGDYNLSGSFRGTANEKDGTRDNSRYTSKSGMIKIGADISGNTDLALALNFLSDKKDVPVNIYTEFPRYWRYGSRENILANLMYGSAVTPDIVLKGNIFYETYKNELDSYDDASFTSQIKKYAFHSVYDDRSYGINFSLFLKGSFLPMTKALFLYKRDQHNEQADRGLSFQKYEAELFTAGLEETFSISAAARASAGISFDRMNPLYASGSPLRPPGSALNANASLSLNYIDYGLSLNASRKTRFPTLKEFYAELIGNYIPNYELSPEQGYNFELAGFKNIGTLTIKTSLFYSYIRNLIEVFFAGNGTRQFRNLSKCILRGIEAEAEYRIPLFAIKLNGMILSARNITDESPVPNRPGLISNIILCKEYLAGFEWEAEASYVSYRYSLNQDTNKLVELPGYLTVNGKIAQRVFSTYKLYLRINNITDWYYESEYGFPQPGREYFAGILAEW